MLGRQGSPSCSGRYHTTASFVQSGQQHHSRHCRSYPQRCRATLSTFEGLERAGPDTSKPEYTSIDAQPLNRAIMALFRRKMESAMGASSSATGYDAIVELTRVLNDSNSDPVATQQQTQQILLSLFPSWLPPAFKVMFSKPMPGLSCRLNAWVTALTCQWLMGPCKVNDVEVDGGKVGKGQGVLVERCRYLEETGCASVCLNSCKVPTQEFFAHNMGLPLTMTPSYEDFSCQFSFGATPPPWLEDEAFSTACFSQCPTKRRHSAQRCPGAVT